MMWWIFLHAVSTFATEAKTVFDSLWGLITLLSQQQKMLSGLLDTYCRMSGMVGPLDREQINAILATEPAESLGRFIICTEKSKHSLMDLAGG
jgi:hypothetical protein